jgi:hypothetical protein
MENIKTVVEASEQATTNARECDLNELNDLQLTLVGGGIGDPIAF